jgi:hypothetical protein
MQPDTPKRATVSFGPALEVGGPRNHGQSQAEPKFFHASEARSAGQPLRTQRPPPQSKNPSTFVYASGESVPPIVKSSGSNVGSAIGSVAGEERGQAKFFHANGTPDLRSASPHYFSPPGSSISPALPSATSPRLVSSIPSELVSPQTRSVSPSKLSHQPSSSSLRSLSAVSSPAPPRPPPSRGQSAQNITAARRISIEASPCVASHGRSFSSGSFESTHSTSKRLSTLSSVDLPSPTSPTFIDTVITVSTPDEIASETLSDKEANADGIEAPIKAGGSIEHLNTLAADARRERKILDLQITNSSLAAINRTLEREMRKQTAELRRFRRLSLSGRLSIAMSESTRSSGTSLAFGDTTDGMQLSDMSEEEEDNDGGDESEDDSFGDGSRDPQASVESDAKHRKKDEKRLQLDLSKHQQLLIDSQRMNESLKRCLGWTEELISEGRKALEYKVNVHDAVLGGRVLVPDDMDYEYGLSNIGSSMLRRARLDAASAATSAATIGDDRSLVETDDRDSGVELEAQRATLGCE